MVDNQIRARLEITVSPDLGFQSESIRHNLEAPESHRFKFFSVTLDGRAITNQVDPNTT